MPPSTPIPGREASEATQYYTWSNSPTPGLSGARGAPPRSQTATPLPYYPELQLRPALLHNADENATQHGPAEQYYPILPGGQPSRSPSVLPSVERPSLPPRQHSIVAQLGTAQERGFSRAKLDNEDLRVLVMLCVKNQETYGIPKQLTKWWTKIEVDLATERKKTYKNAKKKVAELVKERLAFLAALGSGEEDEKTPLNDALDDWIEVLKMYNDDIILKKSIAKENEREEVDAETLRANMTLMRAQKRSAADEDEDESSEDDTPKSGDDISTSQSQTKTPKPKVTKKKKAKMEYEAKTDAALDRLCGIAEKAFTTPSAPASVTVADPRIDRLEHKMEEQSSQLSNILALLQGMRGEGNGGLTNSSA
ncbi:MAG: hypothetical protein Q9180_001316 [Flavoplaca navasiana]